jgi:hypothetical protein
VDAWQRKDKLQLWGNNDWGQSVPERGERTDANRTIHLGERNFASTKQEERLDTMLHELSHSVLNTKDYRGDPLKWQANKDPLGLINDAYFYGQLLAKDDLKYGVAVQLNRVLLTEWAKAEGRPQIKIGAGD